MFCHTMRHYQGPASHHPRHEPSHHAESYNVHGLLDLQCVLSNYDSLWIVKSASRNFLKQATPDFHKSYEQPYSYVCFCPYLGWCWMMDLDARACLFVKFHACFLGQLLGLQSSFRLLPGSFPRSVGLSFLDLQYSQHPLNVESIFMHLPGAPIGSQAASIHMRQVSASRS